MLLPQRILLAASRTFCTAGNSVKGRLPSLSVASRGRPLDHPPRTEKALAEPRQDRRRSRREPGLQGRLPFQGHLVEQFPAPNDPFLMRVVEAVSPGSVKP